ncbi:Rieske 2Fe-2S domain-containing protein [Cyanobium sp. HWJ4-Hawea]|uniref:aromatic ring-hydroxylating dioxygenase subunit alpha n=1 Tax=Cyanobium sp. HWJ4-Hawea TaxID=2823713 RepID=UPI0020CCFE0E|nr:Rieske 2Fe-2S domain-containing protein [Cyanobium sp. HWJ4-Hawea]MCP9808429.1 Rieske 2Fe-2S domain-containing protein [Cyanobium sp. HWJ4-Hawea]
MSWSEQWYPVAYEVDLDPTRPTAFTLLDQDLVLWWDRHGDSWQAFADVCPHRLVPLSEGRINGRGELECPYHGWSFDGMGACTTIPQQREPAEVLPQRSCAKRFETRLAQGLLFVFAGPPEHADAVPLPLVPEVEAPGWVVQDIFRDLPMDALTLLENVLDVSHVPFTHHRTVGRRQNASPVEAELTSFGPEGFTAFWQEGPRRGALGSQHTTFVAPALMWHDLEAKGFARFLTVVYATPMRRGECRLFARFPFRFSSPLPGLLLRLRPQWLQHIANHTILEDDQVFLHWQERALAERGGSASFARSCFLPTAADVYVRALHDWVNRYGGEPFPGQELPPRLGRDALMDRYQAHTLHCRDCSRALKRLRRIRPLLLAGCVAAAVAVGVLPSLVAQLAAGVGLLLLFGLLRQCGIWQQGLLRGDGHPPRNRPDPTDKRC